MSPLETKVWDIGKRKWFEKKDEWPVIEPGQGKVVPSTEPDGTKFLYRFSCALDKSHSLIEISTGRAVDLGGIKYVPATYWKTVRKLMENEYFDVILKNDANSIGLKLRLTHTKK